MNPSMILLNQSISNMKNYVTRIQTALSFILILKINIKTLQIMKSIDHCLQEKTKK